MTLTKYRVVHARGYVEFLSEQNAVTYRDANYPGCEIAVITEEIQPPTD